MKEECVLNKNFAILKTTIFKLIDIKNILKHHFNASAFIMFFFSEMYLIVKRVSVFYY